MAIQATALAFIAVQPIERFILQSHRFVKLVFHFIVSAIIALRGFVMLRVAIVEKRLNAVIDFAEVAVILAELLLVRYMIKYAVVVLLLVMYMVKYIVQC